MSDRIITRECSEYQELYRNLYQAIRNLDILIGMLYFQYQQTVIAELSG